VQSTKAPLTQDIKSPQRSLLAASVAERPSNASTLLTVADGIYLYLEGISMTYHLDPTGNPDPPASFDVSMLEVDERESFCAGVNSTSGGNDSCVLSFNYTGTQPLSVFALRFTFDQDLQGYWAVTRLEMTYANDTNDEGSAETVDMSYSPIYDLTPLGYSYSCSHPDWLSAKNKTLLKSGTVPYITFTRLQLQAFGVYDGKFGYYNDCEGFFGIGIWMALISIAIMISILVFGLIMLSSITTMDRYDDPKGKTIIVATGTD